MGCPRRYLVALTSLGVLVAMGAAGVAGLHLAAPGGFGPPHGPPPGPTPLAPEWLVGPALFMLALGGWGSLLVAVATAMMWARDGFACDWTRVKERLFAAGELRKPCLWRRYWRVAAWIVVPAAVSSGVSHYFLEWMVFDPDSPWWRTQVSGILALEMIGGDLFHLALYWTAGYAVFVVVWAWIKRRVEREEMV